MPQECIRLSVFLTASGLSTRSPVIGQIPPLARVAAMTLALSHVTSMEQSWRGRDNNSVTAAWFTKRGDRKVKVKGGNDGNKSIWLVWEILEQHIEVKPSVRGQEAMYVSHRKKLKEAVKTTGQKALLLRIKINSRKQLSNEAGKQPNDILSLKMYKYWKKLKLHSLESTSPVQRSCLSPLGNTAERRKKHLITTLSCWRDLKASGTRAKGLKPFKYVFHSLHFL